MQTLFGSDRGLGGYIDITSKLTQINNDDALFLGGQLGMVINHSLNLGFAGYGMVSPVLAERTTPDGDSLYLQMGYGGIHFEPILRSNDLLHLTFPVLLGAGGTGYTTRHFWTTYPDGEPSTHFDERIRHSRLFLIAEPGVNLELNLFRWMRMTGGVSYRFVRRLEDDPGTEELSGLSANVGLRFGWF